MSSKSTRTDLSARFKWGAGKELEPKTKSGRDLETGSNTENPEHQ